MAEIDRRSLFLASLASTALAQTAFAQSAARQSGAMADPGHREGETLDRADGSKIFYQVTGKGSPMMLVHGYPLSGALFSRVRDQLSKSHQVITLDLRGYGQSKAAGVTDSVDVYADDAIAVLDKVGAKKAVIGGMSMGGPTILSMYRKAADRFSGMVLIDTTAEAALPPEMMQWQGFEALLRQKGVEAMIPLLLPVMLTGETRLKDKAQVEYLTAIIKQCSMDAAVSGVKTLANRADSTATLAKIDVPTLVLVGLADGLYPFEVGQKMQAAIKGAALHIVPGGAHAAIFEKPDDAGGAIAKWAAGAKV